MQVSLDNNLELYSVRAYDEEGLQLVVPPSQSGRERPEIQRVDYSIILSPQAMRPWRPARLEELEQAHFEELLEWEPEVVLFGSGGSLRFPAMELLVPLQRKGIGIEVMDTVAACRTFNILASEGRRVTAALLMALEE
jgi:uncharacterized protein